MSPRARAKGFTLLELLVVLVLLGIMAVLVAPGLGGSLQGAKLKTASRDLLSTFRLQRGEAVTQGRIVTLDIDPQGRFYRLDGEQVDLAEGLQLVLQGQAGGSGDSSSSSSADGLSPSFKAQGIAANSVAFYPDGSSSGALLQLRLGEAVRYIRIDWLIGEVSLIEDDRLMDGGFMDRGPMDRRLMDGELEHSREGRTP